jgi:serine/threonine protein kinase
VKALQSIEKHPNIIAYYGHFIENETLCIVMEYAAGWNHLVLIGSTF